MRTIAEFIKTTLIGGLLIVLPVCFSWPNPLENFRRQQSMLLSSALARLGRPSSVWHSLARAQMPVGSAAWF
jgi:hypothetical protein